MKSRAAVVLTTMAIVATGNLIIPDSAVAGGPFNMMNLQNDAHPDGSVIIGTTMMTITMTTGITVLPDTDTALPVMAMALPDTDMAHPAMAMALPDTDTRTRSAGTKSARGAQRSRFKRKDKSIGRSDQAAGSGSNAAAPAYDPGQYPTYQQGGGQVPRSAPYPEHPSSKSYAPLSGSGFRPTN